MALGDEYQWCSTRNAAGMTDAALCIPIECSPENLADPVLMATTLFSFGQNLYTGTITCTSDFIATIDALSTIDWNNLKPSDLQKLTVLSQCFMQQRAIDYLNSFTNL